MTDEELCAAIFQADPVELAALYCAGALSPEEAAAFERRLSHGCPASQHEVKQIAPVVAALAAAVLPCAPPPHVRDALLAKIQKLTLVQETIEAAAEEHSHSASGVHAELYFQYASEGVWTTVAAGVRMRMLYLDRKLRRFTALLQLSPGVRYAAHRHPGPEQCFVLQGDLRLGERVLGPGDFQHAQAGTWHEEQWTETGCLCLVSGAMEQLTA